jgi:hypothetical protein
MGFWHTGYMEFHEPTGGTGWSDTPFVPPPPEFPCEQCGEIFRTIERLNVHRFDGHASNRARLFLHGRECGRSRASIVYRTATSDWVFDNAIGITVNGQLVDEITAKRILSSSNGVVNVELRGSHSVQNFEFAFDITDEVDLEAIESVFSELILKRELSNFAIQRFIERCRGLDTSSRYFNGLANYLYGVLAREHSPESALWQDSKGMVTYRSRFDDAVSQLGSINRAPANTVCGLVAFHYNHFDIAIQKANSPRVSQVASRLESIMAADGTADAWALLEFLDSSKLEKALCDDVTERLLKWCAIPLDGSAIDAIKEIEDAIPSADPLDQLKLHLIAGEHYLVINRADQALRHANHLRNTAAASAWQRFVRQRVNEDD